MQAFVSSALKLGTLIWVLEHLTELWAEGVAGGEYRCRDWCAVRVHCRAGWESGQGLDMGADACRVVDELGLDCCSEGITGKCLH